MSDCKHLSRTIAIGLIVLFILFWTPFFIIQKQAQRSTIYSIDETPKSDAAIIFGAHLTEDGDVTPLLQERLDAGVRLFQMKKVQRLVVSNTKDTTNVMARYLESQGVGGEHIEIDSQAETTPDSCMYENQWHPEGRSLLFVSQSFHLPRIIFQCKRASVAGTAVPAELAETIDRSQYTFLTIVTTRINRYIREATLTWLSVLRLY